MVKVFFCKLNEIIKSMNLETLYPYIDEVKLQRIKQKKKNQLESIVAHLLIKYILKHYYYKTDITIGYNDYQKPYLMNDGLYFNFSHSYDYIVCAVSSSEVGIDIEKIRKLNIEKIAKTFFTDNEYEQIKVSGSSDLFFLIWTMKESYLKLIGKGLNEPLKSFEVDIEQMGIRTHERQANLKVYEIDSKYKLSVCSRKDLFSKEMEYIKIEDLIIKEKKSL